MRVHALPTVYTMTISTNQPQAIPSHGWRNGTSRSTAVTNIKGAFDEDTSTVLIMHRWFARFAKEDMVFEDKLRDARGMLYYELLLQGHTVTATTYAA